MAEMPSGKCLAGSFPAKRVGLAQTSLPGGPAPFPRLRIEMFDQTDDALACHSAAVFCSVLLVVFSHQYGMTVPGSGGLDSSPDCLTDYTPFCSCKVGGRTRSAAIKLF